MLGIYIHNLNCPRNGTCTKGDNPFDHLAFKDGTKLSSKVKCYNPSPYNAYKVIRDNLEAWVEEAIQASYRR